MLDCHLLLSTAHHTFELIYTLFLFHCCLRCFQSAPSNILLKDNSTAKDFKHSQGSSFELHQSTPTHVPRKIDRYNNWRPAIFFVLVLIQLFLLYYLWFFWGELLWQILGTATKSRYEQLEDTGLCFFRGQKKHCAHVDPSLKYFTILEHTLSTHFPHTFVQTGWNSAMATLNTQTIIQPHLWCHNNIMYYVKRIGRDGGCWKPHDGAGRSCYCAAPNRSDGGTSLAELHWTVEFGSSGPSYCM